MTAKRDNSRTDLVRNTLKNNSYALLLFAVFIAVIGLFTAIKPNYIRINSFQSMFSNAAFKGMAVVGELLVMLAGGLDFSVGAVIGFSTLMCLAFNIVLHMPLPLLILSIICIGALIGFINGIIIKVVGINPVITTLGTSFIISACGYLFQRNWLALTERPRIESTLFAKITDGFVGIFPLIFIYPLILFIIAFFILKYTTFGRSLFVAGQDTRMAEILGFKAKKIQIATYVVSGICAALGGLLLSSQLLTGRPGMGADSTLDILIIVILGGTLIGGGKTDIAGVFITWILLEALANGLVITNIPYFLRQTITGILLIIAIGINTARTRELKK
jgi:ribose/xylose/arabinose/galactoside ABC-type transport system permease subunit